MSALVFWQDTGIEWRQGETIAATLVRAGLRDLNGGRHFCGIGQCQNCVVLVDGDRPVEACITLAAPGMRLLPASGVVG